MRKIQKGGNFSLPVYDDPDMDVLNHTSIPRNWFDETYNRFLDKAIAFRMLNTCTPDSKNTFVYDLFGKQD